MADTTLTIKRPGTTDIEIPLVDNGDGTHSPRVNVQANIDLDIEAADIGSAVGDDLRAGASIPTSEQTATQNLQPNSTQADQALTVDATAGGVQFSAFHADTTHVCLDVQTADVMCTFDDSAPTSTNGHRLYVGDQYVWLKARAAAAKFIRVTSTSGLVHASQMKGA